MALNSDLSVAPSLRGAQLEQGGCPEGSPVRGSEQTPRELSTERALVGDLPLTAKQTCSEAPSSRGIFSSSSTKLSPSPSSERLFSSLLSDTCVLQSGRTTCHSTVCGLLVSPAVWLCPPAQRPAHLRAPGPRASAAAGFPQMTLPSSLPRRSSGGTAKA